MTTHSLFRSAVSLVLFALIINGCKKESDPAAPPAEDEHAPPTTMIVVLKAAGSTDSTTSLVRDTSVVKGKPRIVDTLRVTPGKSYSGYITLIDESQTPAFDATQEIIDDQINHLFVFTPLGGMNGRIAVTNLNKDTKGFDFGLTFTLTPSGTGAASGTLQIKLRHYGGNPKTGDVYDTDIDQSLPIVIR